MIKIYESSKINILKQDIPDGYTADDVMAVFDWIQTSDDAFCDKCRKYVKDTDEMVFIAGELCFLMSIDGGRYPNENVVAEVEDYVDEKYWKGDGNCFDDYFCQMYMDDPEIRYAMPGIGEYIKNNYYVSLADSYKKVEGINKHPKAKKKTTKSNIKKMINSGQAISLDGMSDKEIEDIKGKLTKIMYAMDVNGNCVGSVYVDRYTDELYASTNYYRISEIGF